jgi:hypothetical protein
MNKHLRPVFNILLPELERARIDYWVYGGIGIAAIMGDFIRENRDVDIFIKESEFKNARSVLDDVCNQYNFKLLLKRNLRPKLEVIEKSEIFSVVPVYLEANLVKFRFMNGSAEYPYRILQKVERHISSYRFFTPPNEYIKKLFIKYLTLRPKKKKEQKTKIDARAILTGEEFNKLFPLSR